MDILSVKNAIFAWLRKIFKATRLESFDWDDAICALIVLGLMSVIAAKLPWPWTALCVVVFAALVGWLEMEDE